MLDKFNRKIEYARISLTDLCNFKCLYCMPEKGLTKKNHSDILKIEEFYEVIDCLTELGINKIRLTGGEPLLKKGVQTLIKQIGENSKILTKGLTTNGFYLPQFTKVLKDGGFENINISCDSLDKENYAKITRGGKLDDALLGIDCAKANFDTVKINCVVMKNINDNEILSIIDFCQKRNIMLRFIELMPFGYQKDFYKEHFISLDYIKDSIAAELKCDNYVNSGKDSYLEKDGYKIGFIMPMSHNFCDSCNRIRILSDGRLLNCLHGNTYYDFKPYLGNKSQLFEYLKTHIYEKQKENAIFCGELQNRYMKDIGG